MRVGLFTREYPPEIYGCAGVHVDYLSRELAKEIEAGLFADEKLAGGLPCRGAGQAELSLLAAEGLRAKQRLI